MFFKALKIAIISIVIYFIYSVGNLFYLFFKGHKANIYSHVNHNWIFNDSTKEKIYSYGSNWTTKRDTLSGFRYDQLGENEDKRFFVKLWEFNDLNHEKINELRIHFNVNLNSEKEPDEYEILDNKGDLSIVVRYDYNFNQGFNLNFPKSDSSVYFEKKPNLRFVYGKFDYITITNGKKEEQIVFRNMHSNNYTAFFVFRKQQKNYLALVHSDYYFGKDIAKIFTFYEN